MSDQVTGSSTVSGSEGSSSVEAANTAATTGGTKTTATSNTMISSVNQLRTEHPDLYNKILLGMAQNACIQINRQNNRTIEAMKKLRREGR
jgi:hypothetical protein